jgi:hypothetical protein
MCFVAAARYKNNVLKPALGIIICLRQSHYQQMTSWTLHSSTLHRPAYTKTIPRNYHPNERPNNPSDSLAKSTHPPMTSRLGCRAEIISRFAGAETRADWA